MNTLQLIQSCSEKINNLEKMIPISQFQNRIDEIDHLISNPKTWNDPKGTALLMKERQKLSDLVNKLLKFQELNKFNIEFSENCPGNLDDLIQDVNNLYQEVSDLEFKMMLNDPIDNTPAILSISAGAGGLEAANWVSMLLRMYSRYAENQSFKIEILDFKESEDHSSICTDSVSIRIEGPFAYGFFKGESGVHRLIRNSPFNAADARQTSFAAVYTTADIEDTIDIKIEEKDLEITAQTAGGPGGQHQNKVSSAVRIKHIPTGINILVRTERSQLANKKTAFKMLKAKLYDLEIKSKKEKIEKEISNLSDISFGHQCRTYTMSPYKLVKDHRTGYEVNDVDDVLDGNINDFMLAFLKMSRKNVVCIQNNQ